MAEDEEPEAQYSEVEAVMSAAGVPREEAERHLEAAKQSVDIAVVRAHNQRRQQERSAERAAMALEPGAELERMASEDMPPLSRTVSSFVGRSVVWVDCLFAEHLAAAGGLAPPEDTPLDTLRHYIRVTLTVGDQVHTTQPTKRAARPDWHASFPFVVPRKHNFWVAVAASSLDGRVLAAGGVQVTASAHATASFTVPLLATVEADVDGGGSGGGGAARGGAGTLHLAARKLRGKPQAEVDEMLAVELLHGGGE
eukprot:SAG22_NODE_689_length_7904_cov_3.365279_8_plen_254_part_00